MLEIFILFDYCRVVTMQNVIFMLNSETPNRLIHHGRRKMVAFRAFTEFYGNFCLLHGL